MRYYRDKAGGFGLGVGGERLTNGRRAFYLRLGRYHHEWSWGDPK